MDLHQLSQKKVAKELNVSESYVSQILNGNSNFTLKKLIELSLFMNKVPDLNFVSLETYYFNKTSKHLDRYKNSFKIFIENPDNLEALPYEKESRIENLKFTTDLKTKSLTHAF